MWPFKKQNTREQAAPENVKHPAVSIIQGLPGIMEWSHVYGHYIREAYFKSPTTRACTRLRCQALAGLPLMIVKKTKDGIESMPDHPLWDKLYWPNEEQDWAAFISLLQTHLIYGGRAFALKLGTAQKVGAITLLRPDRVTVNLNAKRNSIVSYEYGHDGGKYKPEEICYIKYEHPLDWFDGTSPLRAIANVIDIEVYGNRWNMNMLANSGVPSTLFTAKEGTEMPSPETRREIERDFKNKFGGENVGAPGFMTGGFEPKNLGYAPKDMEWGNSLISAKIDICNALGVPPELAGVQGQKTYSNFETAARVFYEHTVIPEAEAIYGMLSRLLLSDPSESILVDVDNVPAMKEDNDKRALRARESFGMGGMSLAEYTQQINAGDPPDHLADLRVIQAGYMPLEDVMLGLGGDFEDVNPKNDDGT